LNRIGIGPGRAQEFAQKKTAASFRIRQFFLMQSVREAYCGFGTAPPGAGVFGAMAAGAFGAAGAVVAAVGAVVVGAVAFFAAGGGVDFLQ
jgi:hypothetical protein